jgi:DNA-binding transcriptional ArsR family regulator
MKNLINMENFLVNENGYIPAQPLGKEGVKALENQYRKEILEMVLHKERTVSEIIDKLDLDEQTGYYHVQILEQSGIIQSEGGNPKYFRPSAEGFFYLPDNSEFIEGPINSRKVPELLEDFVEDHQISYTIVVEDSSPEYYPSYRYKVADITSFLGQFGEQEKAAMKASEAERTGLESNLILVGRPKYNRMIRKFCEDSEIELEGSTTVNGKTYEASRTGLIYRKEDKLLITGNSDLGVSSAIKALTDYADEFEEYLVVQGFGNAEHVEEVDVLEKN